MAPGTVTLLKYTMRMMAWANILPMSFFIFIMFKSLWVGDVLVYENRKKRYVIGKLQYVSRETYPVKHISRQISAIHSRSV